VRCVAVEEAAIVPRPRPGPARIPLPQLDLMCEGQDEAPRAKEQQRYQFTVTSTVQANAGPPRPTWQSFDPDMVVPWRFSSQLAGSPLATPKSAARVTMKPPTLRSLPDPPGMIAIRQGLVVYVDTPDRRRRCRPRTTDGARTTLLATGPPLMASLGSSKSTTHGTRRGQPEASAAAWVKDPPRAASTLSSLCRAASTFTPTRWKRC
jgi:hypothetical protein